MLWQGRREVKPKYRRNVPSGSPTPRDVAANLHASTATHRGNAASYLANAATEVSNAALARFIAASERKCAAAEASPAAMHACCFTLLRYRHSDCADFAASPPDLTASL
jgi:hypothetical protein